MVGGLTSVNAPVYACFIQIEGVLREHGEMGVASWFGQGVDGPYSSSHRQHPKKDGSIIDTHTHTQRRNPTIEGHWMSQGVTSCLQ